MCIKWWSDKLAIYWWVHQGQRLSWALVKPLLCNNHTASCHAPHPKSYNIIWPYHTIYSRLYCCFAQATASTLPFIRALSDPLQSTWIHHFLPSYLFPARLTYVVVARFAFLTTRWQGSPSLLPQRIVLGELMSRKGVCVANWSPPVGLDRRIKNKRKAYIILRDDQWQIALCTGRKLYEKALVFFSMIIYNIILCIYIYKYYWWIISSMHSCLSCQDFHMNLIDTPGHVDFTIEALDFIRLPKKVILSWHVVLYIWKF